MNNLTNPRATELGANSSEMKPRKIRLATFGLVLTLALAALTGCAPSHSTSSGISFGGDVGTRAHNYDFAISDEHGSDRLRILVAPQLTSDGTEISLVTNATSVVVTRQSGEAPYVWTLDNELAGSQHAWRFLADADFRVTYVFPRSDGSTFRYEVGYIVQTNSDNLVEVVPFA